MPPRWTYWEWKAWKARWAEPTTPTIPTIHENTELTDGEESNGSQPTESDVKAHSKVVGYDWMLPISQQYKVIEKDGKRGKPRRVGTVTCKYGGMLLAHWDDDGVQRRDTSTVVRIEVPSQPPQYQ